MITKFLEENKIKDIRFDKSRYDLEDIKIFKKVIKDYTELKTLIDILIKGGYTIEDLYDFIEQKLSNTNITNVELNTDYKYIDFNYQDMTISILQHDNNGVYLGESIEIWNDKKNEYIGTFNNVKELENIIHEYWELKIDKLYEIMKNYICNSSDEELEKHFEWYKVNKNNREDLLNTMWESYCSSYDNEELEERINMLNESEEK